MSTPSNGISKNERRLTSYCRSIRVASPRMDTEGTTIFFFPVSQTEIIAQHFTKKVSGTSSPLGEIQLNNVRRTGNRCKKQNAKKQKQHMTFFLQIKWWTLLQIFFLKMCKLGMEWCKWSKWWEKFHF